MAETKDHSFPIETTQKTAKASLTPSEKVLLKEQTKKEKVSLTPSERILAREKIMRGEMAQPRKEDFATGKAYRRPDTENGILTNETEIEFYKLTQIKDIFSNGLLGVYDEEGNYVIEEEIRKELVALNKSCGENFEDTYFAISRCKDDFFKTIKFSLQIEVVDDETKTATLKVLEEVEKSGGLFNNTVATFVAEYTDKSDEEFTTNAFKLFNISSSTDNQTNFLVEDLAPVTMNRKNNLKALFGKYIKEFSKEEKDLLESRIKLLENGGPEGKRVLEKLNDALQQLDKYNPNQQRMRGSKPFLANNILEALVESLVGDNIFAAFSAGLSRQISSIQQSMGTNSTLLNLARNIANDKTFASTNTFETASKNYQGPSQIAPEIKKEKVQTKPQRVYTPRDRTL